jgi:murein DD-endopeptidase MepM/ murein hydrolase activator NlpD
MVHQRETKREKKKQITFMLLPHNSGRNVFRLNLPYWLASLLAAILIIIMLGITGFFIYSTKITTRLLQYYAIQAENKRQEKQLKVFISKIKELESGVRELEERDQELREMLGLEKRSRKQSNNVPALDNAEEAIARMVALQQRIDNNKEEFKTFKSVAVAVRYKFDSLPSIWPSSGDIRSDYGWRKHPFTGRLQFHKGVDIPSWVGLPISAAADGVITFCDWLKGYGNAVIIDHKNGYATVYGHCSRIVVKKWDKVTKGQVIATIGDTGLATGPHLHYEVRYNNKTLNPNGFLDLNIRSARNF